ncbi:protein LONGIFOLIA 1 isoform X1 [Cajanus cajan]|uniref:protein LONGIFOLIA 1 isoform X1 n=1 Tax=Cajanus cajan TaxID=3821 RepID=UPI00098DA4EC|nr:protein LONGIFOLIA 1 isoform X1 [Cajanus cajan]
MSGKALKSLKDENPDLQKQIGCITGFFQLFDRHRFITGQGTSSYIQHNTSVGSGNEIKELNGTILKAKAKNLKNAREKQQFSTESSITSLSSSSCSSSMSSLEFNRTIQTQSPSRNHIKIHENTNPKVAKKQLDTPCQQSPDFHHIVKDSMHKEAQGLSLKTVVKEEKKAHTNVLKHIDSPRPLRSHRSFNEGHTVSSELSHPLAKSKKTPWDSPRLSYDDTFKSATKHKELPRLSLDSREGSNKGFNEGNKLKGSHKGYGRNSSTMINQPHEPETSKRSSSLVAKLMGLEALPECTQTCGGPMGTPNCPIKKNELLGRSSTSDEDKQHQRFTLPQSRKADSITNVTPYSRFSLESSLWRQPDASQSSQLQASKGSESVTKASKPSLTVYGEIEKRVAELEFKKSGKDLRALKQILEAMQRHKDSLDIAGDQASNSPSDNSNSTSLNESSKLQSPRGPQKDMVSVTIDLSNSTRGSKLPIVIMKPAKVTRKHNNPSSTELPIHGKSGLSRCSSNHPTNGRLIQKQTAKVNSSTTKSIKDHFGQQVLSSDKNNNIRTSKSMQSLKVPQDRSEESTTNSGYITVTGSPRLQKKYGLDRRSQPISPSSDSRINRREHNRQPMELSSPSTTPRHNKFSTSQQRNERISEISCHWRDFKHHLNVISDFDDKSSASHSEAEFIRIDQSGKIINTSIQNAFEDLRKELSKAEATVTAEQPSPVSVLDAAFYREDPPSPVKKKSDNSKKLCEALSTDDDSEQNSVEIQEIDWFDEKFINFNNIKDPDHKYISEILLASGLLSGHSPSQIFHSPGHLINPNLFFELEQMKKKMRHFDDEVSATKIPRMQRKLIFDVVNDILVQKQILHSSSASTLKGKQLLDELCTEIDQLQAQNGNVSIVHEDEDLKHHHAIWTNCCSEVPNIVLDIERLIFKDLVNEVVRGDVAKHRTHCRQLVFPK